MELQEVIRTRRMVRAYADEPVAPEQIDRMLRNAVRAPSAGFSQGWSFLVLDSRDDLERYWQATSPAEGGLDAWLRGMRTAPVLIVALCSKEAYIGRYAEADKGWTDRDEAHWPVPYWHVDVGMASMLILETAVDEGLGACFFGIGAGEIESFRAAFDVPSEWFPTGVIAVGHPAEGGAEGSPRRRRRKPMHEVVHTGRFGAQA